MNEKQMQFRFAIVDGTRREAQRGLSGECEFCGQAMIAKCGEQRVWHWAHRGSRICDHWWEPETPWHRAWKDHFPKDWQEITHHSEDGEKHIADVRTESGVVLEFQHSHLHREERTSREIFFRRMVWVVDGLRRKRDRSQFFASLAKPSIVRINPLIVSLPSDGCALLRDWAPSRAPVFFDFGDSSEPGDTIRFNGPVLWRLLKRGFAGKALLMPVAKAAFRDASLKGQKLKGIKAINAPAAFDKPLTLRFALPSISQDHKSSSFRRYAKRPLTFRQYLARRKRSLPRF
jgi:competence protein CoiA